MIGLMVNHFEISETDVGTCRRPKCGFWLDFKYIAISRWEVINFMKMTRLSYKKSFLN